MIGDLATEDGRVAFSSVVLVDRVDGEMGCGIDES